MATINGVAVNFGFTGTNGITITGLSGELILQKADESAEAEREIVRGGTGDKVVSAWYGQCKKATLNAVITGTGLAAAVTNTTLAGALPGAFLAVTVCASMPDLVNSYWEVLSGSKIEKTNTGNAMMTLLLEYNANITGAAGA
jgi:hypothetical protein